MFAILGATGNTGRIVAEALLAAGEEVRALVRSEDKGAALAAKGAEVRVVDVDDEASLRAGLAGARGAYLLLPPPDMSQGGFLASRAAVAKRIADAVAASELEHVVLLSSVGAQHAEGTGVIRSLHDAEARLLATGVPATFVRAAYFMENWGSVLPAAKGDGVLPQMLGDARAPVPMVATPDIGRIAAEALLEGPRAAGVVELEGPARYAPTDVAAAVRRRLGREVRAIDVPFEAQVPTFQSFGMSEDVASLFTEMNRGIASGHVGFTDEGRHVRGTTTIDDVLGALLG